MCTSCGLGGVGMPLASGGSWLDVAGCVVPGEDVAAEIALRVAPDGVNVVGIPLGVVVFDQQPRALDAVVMRPPRLGAAGPGEMQLPGSGARDLRVPGLGGLVRETAEI